MQSHYKDALIQIITFLERLEETHKIKYHLVGGILVNLYSDFRTTRDIDLAISFKESSISTNDYIELLKQNNFKAYQDWESAKTLAKEISMIQFLDTSETIRFDNHIVVYSTPNQYKKIGPLSMKRRVRATVFGVECWVSSKEDFILSKLVYGGWQDYRDALGCWMRFKEDLDIPYLKEKSKLLNIEKEFTLLESGIEDPDEFFERLA